MLAPLEPLNESAPGVGRSCAASIDRVVSNGGQAMYEVFDELTPFDLDGCTLSFVPDGDSTRYTVSVGPLDWDTSMDGGSYVGDEDISECDDCYVAADLDFSFSFYGRPYDTVFPSANGYVTFGSGDPNYEDSIAGFLADPPRIAAMFDDLDTRGTGEVYLSSSSAQLVVTYRKVLHFPTTPGSNTFQIALLADGSIKISYHGVVPVEDSAIVGISPGSAD